jgi:hypothetical protein
LLLPAGIAFDMVVNMLVVGFQTGAVFFIVVRKLDGGAEILKSQEWSHVIGEIHKSDCSMSKLWLLTL